MNKIGNISKHIQSLLNIDIVGDSSIYLGESNIEHMISRPPHDYKKYGVLLPEILNHPDYVGKNKKNDSIEFVKEFKIDNEYVKVAVRITGNKKYYARTLYILKNSRVKNFISKGTLKKV
jgi:hypothetical protein